MCVCGRGGGGWRGEGGVESEYIGSGWYISEELP